MDQKVYFGDFRKLVIEKMKEIENDEPEPYSREWFLLRYFKRIKKETNPPSDYWRVESSVRSLIRFYVDNIDEKSANGQRCRFVYRECKKVLKKTQESKYT